MIKFLLFYIIVNLLTDFVKNCQNVLKQLGKFP